MQCNAMPMGNRSAPVAERDLRERVPARCAKVVVQQCAPLVRLSVLGFEWLGFTSVLGFDQYVRGSGLGTSFPPLPLPPFTSKTKRAPLTPPPKEKGFLNNKSHPPKQNKNTHPPSKANQIKPSAHCSPQSNEPLLPPKWSQPRTASKYLIAEPSTLCAPASPVAYRSPIWPCASASPKSAARLNSVSDSRWLGGAPRPVWGGVGVRGWGSVQGWGWVGCWCGVGVGLIGCGVEVGLEESLLGGVDCLDEH